MCEERVDKIDHTSNTIGAGLNLAMSCIDVDLKELDDHVTYHHHKCKKNKVVINLCQGQVSELEHIIETQAQMIAHLEEKIEEVVCKCCAQDKGKGKQRAVVPNSPILGSSIVLAQSSDHEESLDSSYVTPPLTARSPSIITLHSITLLQLVEEEQDIPMRPPGIGLPSPQEMLEKEDEGMVFHQEMATMAVEIKTHLGAVHGQWAYHTLSPPKHLFNPYPTICHFLETSKWVQHYQGGGGVRSNLGVELSL